MDLDFSTEEKMIREEAANFLKKECPYELVKEIEESEEGYSPAMWRKLADLGWLGLVFPAEFGGDGGRFMDLVIVQEEMGKMACPSPFFSTIIQCGLLLMEGGSPEQQADLLPRIMDGSLIMALAQYEADGSYQVSDLQMAAEPQADGFLLNGTKLFVRDANIAGKIMVAAVLPNEGATLFIVDASDPGVSCEKMPTIAKDNTCEVIFKDVPVAKEQVIGAKGGAEALLAKMNARAAVAKSAEMLGACRVCIDMTADYAKQRVQYGKPIGGFQAIQHYMSNMLIHYDTNYQYLWRITCMIDEGEDFELDAAALKARVNEAYKFISERAVQIHGGMGTTRECDIGLFYRRAKSEEYVCGDTDFLYELVFDKLSRSIAT